MFDIFYSQVASCLVDTAEQLRSQQALSMHYIVSRVDYEDRLTLAHNIYNLNRTMGGAGGV